MYLRFKPNRAQTTFDERQPALAVPGQWGDGSSIGVVARFSFSQPQSRSTPQTLSDWPGRQRSKNVPARSGEELGNPDHVILGIDRLDYTKGIDARLKAFSSLLDRSPDKVEQYAFVQLAVPSREQVPAYQELRLDIEQSISRINGEYGELGRVPISYLYRSLPFEELVAYYVAADIMLVTPSVTA